MTTRTPKPAQITLETLPQLFAHHRERFGGFRMVDDPPAPTPPAPTPPAPAPTPPAPTPPAPAPTPPTPTPPPGFLSQEKVDEIVQKRLAEEKTKFDAQLKELQENAGKTELEKLTAERDKYKQQVETGGKTTGEALAKTEAKVQALVVGGRDDRLTQIIAQADLSEAYSEDGTVDEAKVKAAIEKVLTDFPEWKRTPGKSGGELGGGAPGDKPTFTRQQIKDMSPEERVKRIDELNAAAAEGRITG